MAFLDVIVRTFNQRPRMLQRNLDSLAALTDPDWRRVLVVDDAARGCAWANQNLSTVQVAGEYVWILDDDNLCCRPSLIEELRTIVATETHRPDVIMVRVFHARFGVLPPAETWQQRPVHGKVDSCCFIVRGELWNAHRLAWPNVYHADYLWIDHLWQQPGLHWYWHDVTAAWCPQASMGAPEELLEL